MKHQLSDYLTRSEACFVRKKLSEFSESFAGPRNYRELSIALRNENGEVFGGLVANILWEWLRIDVLWVTEGLRGKGYGRQLLKYVESTAMEMGCKKAMVETFEFEAVDFYERSGYAIHSRLEGFPDGHTHYRLIKHLERPGGG